MNKKIVFMFSGQGAQYYHMGSELFTKKSLFSEWLHRLDEKIYEMIGCSVLEELYNDERKKSELFRRTLYTHPAIFMVEYALAQVLLEVGIKPDFVLGTSMGEFASCALAGVMSYDAVLESVVTQAQVLEEGENGGMLAILDDVSLYENTFLLHERSELAGVNYSRHFVVSGLDEDLLFIKEYLKSKAINYQLLPVSQAFHSSNIDAVSSSYRSYLSDKTFDTPTIPLISCSRVCVLEEIPQNYFWEVVRKPVLFYNTIKMLEDRANYFYIDLGPSGTLSNFVKYSLDESSQSTYCHVLTPFGNDVRNLEQVKELVATRIT
ncbi:acyltransferase domain-containing protein [Chlamydiota bacterium]